jgi:hypothetical protein
MRKGLSFSAPRLFLGFDRVEEIGKVPEPLLPLLSGPFPAILTDVPAEGQSASTVALAFLKRSNSMLSFHDVKPMAAHFAAFKAVTPRLAEREISALMQDEWGTRGRERPAHAPIGLMLPSLVRDFLQPFCTIRKIPTRCRREMSW